MLDNKIHTKFLILLGKEKIGSIIKNYTAYFREIHTYKIYMSVM